MNKDEMTPKQLDIYDRAPWQLQQHVDAASAAIGGMALEAWANANPRPYQRPRPKVNDPMTPDRTTVDPDPRLPPERDE